MQSPGWPGFGGGAGPDGWTSPAQIVSRPHERSTRPKAPLCDEPPSGRVVLQTCPGATVMEVRTRPAADRASTVQGSTGRSAVRIAGGGPPAGYRPTWRPLTKRVTSSVVPFERPSAGRSSVGAGRRSVLHATTAAATASPEPTIARRPRMPRLCARGASTPRPATIEPHRASDVRAMIKFGIWNPICLACGPRLAVYAGNSCVIELDASHHDLARGSFSGQMPAQTLEMIAS